MTRFKKIGCLLLSLAMLASTACSKSSGSSSSSAGISSAQVSSEEDSRFNNGGVSPICKEKVSLTICMAENANVEDYATNFQTQMLKEYGNYDLSFVTYPSADFNDKISVMVAAGGEELADVIIKYFSDPMVYSFAQQGALIPLTEYYNDPDIAYYLTEAVDRTGVDYKPMITSPDGEIYYIPSYNQSLLNEYPAKIWIYQPWLDTLNLEAPTDADSLYNVLKAFVANDLNGNGKADEIGLAACKEKTYDYWIEGLMNMFVYAGGTNYYTVDDGNFGFAFLQDGWLEGLTYINKLYSEGLITPLIFTQDDAQYKAMLGQEDTIVGMAINMAMGALPAGDARRSEYVGIAPLKGKDGTQVTTYVPSAPNCQFVITKNCADPEAAFRLGDLLTSEELSIHTRWGEKGVDWVEPSAGDTSMFADLGYDAVIKETGTLTWGTVQNKHWTQIGPYIRQYSIALGMVWDGSTNSTDYMVSRIQGEYTGKGPEEVIPKLILNDEESEETSEILATLNTYVSESIGGFVTGALNLTADWEAFKNECKTIGVDTIIEVYQGVYDRMYK